MDGTLDARTMCAPRRARWVQRADAAPAVPLLSYFCSAEPQINGPASAHSSALSTPRPPPSAVPSSSCSSCSLTAFMIHFLLFVCIKCVLLARSLLLVVVCFVLSLSPSLLLLARSLACGGPLAIITWSWPLVIVTRHSACSCGSDKTRRRRRRPVSSLYFFLAAQINTHKQTMREIATFIHQPLRPKRTVDFGRMCAG